MSTFIRTRRCRHSLAVSANTMRSTLMWTLRWFSTERLLESKWVLIFCSGTNMVERLLNMLRYLLCFHTANYRRARSLALIDHIYIIEVWRKVIYYNFRYRSTLRRCLIFDLCDFLLLAHHSVYYSGWLSSVMLCDKLSTTGFYSVIHNYNFSINLFNIFI